MNAKVSIRSIIVLSSFILMAASWCVSQEIHLSHETAKGRAIVFLKMSAKSSYEAGGHTITPVLALQCTKKGKKYEHELFFNPGDILIGDPMGFQFLSIEVDNYGMASTTWSYQGMEGGSPIYKYEGPVGKFFNAPQRLHAIESMFGRSSVHVQFMPYMSNPVISEFNISEIKTVYLQQPECSSSNESPQK